MNASNKVYLQKYFSHPIERVFEALTNADMILKWFGPINTKTISTKVDLVKDGSYTYEIQKKDNSIFLMHGEYLEIDPPSKLRFTASYENLPEMQSLSSIVTIQLSSVENQTLLSFTQEFATEPPGMANRTASWELMFNRLEDLL